MHDHRIVVDEQLPLVAEVLPESSIIRVAASNITNDYLRRHNATALLIRSTTRVTYDLLKGTPVSFVGSATAGMDHVETDLLHDRNIRVVGAPGCNANAVAEYVMTWLEYLGIERSTIGIIGFGNVGKLLARYTLAMGHRVVINDPPLADIGYAFPTSVSHVSLDELLRQSDVVSLHTPYTTDGPHATHNLLDTVRIRAIQHGTLVVNAARGGIINEQALVARTGLGEIDCVLDVFHSEPDISVETIDTVKHITPHVAGYTQTAKNRGALMVLKALRAHLSLQFDIPTLDEIPVVATTKQSDADIVVNHPFRAAWLTDPSPKTFEMCRRLTPLRNEHLQPPTWEELNGHRA